MGLDERFEGGRVCRWSFEMRSKGEESLRREFRQEFKKIQRSLGRSPTKRLGRDSLHL